MFNTWNIAESDQGKIDIVWENYRGLIEPKSNFRLNRFHLQKYNQSNTETDKWWTSS